MLDQVKKALLQFGNFSDADVEKFGSYLRLITINKNNLLVKEGDVCREFYFVTRGCFRHYEIKEDGQEAILNLYVEGDWLFEYKSFMTQQRSSAIIEAVEDSEVYKLTGYDFHELVKSTDLFFRVGRIFEQAFQNQDYQHNRLSPDEKYDLLLESKPVIIQKFPLKYIASYLGMTPETLSRIRRKKIS